MLGIKSMAVCVLNMEITADLIHPEPWDVGSWFEVCLGVFVLFLNHEAKEDTFISNTPKAKSTKTEPEEKPK